jgi:serine/threonine protein kinase
VSEFSSQRRWLLTDFGCSGIFGDNSQALSRERRGTDAYRAPELADVTYDASGNSRPGLFSKESDIWALGCILYQVATTNNCRAFQNDYCAIAYKKGWDEFPLPQVRELDNKHLKQEVVFPESLPLWKQINIIVELCFRRDPKERATALELKEQFLRLREVVGAVQSESAVCYTKW